jgi:catechol 2,3-dioxygenase-like lactoylglutathione lyase family enzyme
MSILGIESLVFGVDDLTHNARFWSDFGLRLLASNANEYVFEVDSGSKLVLCDRADPVLPPQFNDRPTLRETIWGVDTEQALERLVKDLETDRKVTRDADGTAHFVADDGIPLGLRVWRKRAVFSQLDPANAPGNIQRLNLHRKWRIRAIPKTINHVVYLSDDYVASIEFYIKRLGFRLTDHFKNSGAFARADGTLEHHSIFFFSSDLPLTRGKSGYLHSAFGLEDIDELMLGRNIMEQRGWVPDPTKSGGLSRHRASSALYCYVHSPSGGEAEYHVDTDYLDDNWIPRLWEWKFGSMLWSHHLPARYREEPITWDVTLDPEGKSLDLYRKKK